MANGLKGLVGTTGKVGSKLSSHNNSLLKELGGFMSANPEAALALGGGAGLLGLLALHHKSGGDYYGK